MLALSIRDRHEAKRKITNIALFTAQLLETMVYGPVRGMCSNNLYWEVIYLISYFIK